MSACFHHDSIMRKEKNCSKAGRERIKLFTTKHFKWEETWDNFRKTERWLDVFGLALPWPGWLRMDWKHNTDIHLSGCCHTIQPGYSSRSVSTIFLLLLLCYLYRFGCWIYWINLQEGARNLTSNHPRKCVYSTLWSIVTYKVKVSLIGLVSTSTSRSLSFIAHLSAFNEKLIILAKTLPETRPNGSSNKWNSITI